MTTNLVQNYINPVPANTTLKKQPAVTLENTTPDYSVLKKPLPPKGRLVNGGLFDWPTNLAHNALYNIKSIRDSYNGDANDHQLGKINDIGLVVGGLGIAGYLSTLRSTPKTKVMEFIGLGSFLASMAIWPKIALQLPAYLIHGFNVQQQSEDSFGRRKPFFEDPQYIKWDLYSDKDINKIGDRMNVPTDMKNRREYIQEKMKKIAVQNNTMWMLTAGFATPIMSALICNAAEKPLDKYFEEVKNKKADKLIADVAGNASKYQDKAMLANLEKVISANKDGRLDAKLLGKLSDVLTSGMFNSEILAFKKDFSKMFECNEVNLGLTAAQDLSKNLKQFLKSRNIPGLKEGLPKEFIDEVIPTQDEYVDFLKSNNLYETSFNASQKEIRAKKILISKPVLERFEKIKSKYPNIRLDVEDMQDLLWDDAEDTKNVFTEIFKKNKVKIFTLEEQENVRRIAKKLSDFSAERSVLNEYVFMKTSPTQDSVLATSWNESVSELINVFGFDKQEIAKMKKDRLFAGELFTKKIEGLTANSKSYQEALTKIIEIKDKFTSTLHLDKNYDEKSDKLYDKFLEEFDSFGFKNLHKALDGNEIGTDAKEVVGSCSREMQKKFMRETTLSVQSTMNRLIATMDLYRRIADLKNIGLLTDNNTPREIKEEIAEFARKIMVDGHSADYAVKFVTDRNLHPNMDDKSGIEIKNGRLFRKYGQNVDKGDIPFDSSFFNRVISLIYKDDLHPETAGLLAKKGDLMTTIAEYRDNMIKNVADALYFAKPECGANAEIPDKLKFMLIGKPLDELVHEQASKRFNSNKWFKMFAGFGAGLLAVTVLAQFMFGKMPVQKNTKIQKPTGKEKK